MAEPGRLYVGTSGFAYPAWAPAFYPTGTPARALLGAYAGRLSACELNTTFYRHPSERTIDGWASATPPEFRFAVKAQRGGSLRALLVDPAIADGWLTAPYRRFGARLGTVLFRIPRTVPRDDERLGRLLAAWPADLPLTIDAETADWEVDKTLSALARAGAAWCVTDRDGQDPPTLRALGPWLYIRLRRESYDDADLDAWAARIVPFVDDGRDVYVFFRHDADGSSAVRAVDLARRVGALRARP